MTSRTPFIVPRHIGVLFLAVVLSVTVWVLANAEQNPEVTGAFASPIPVEVSGLPKGMVVYGQGPGSVIVKIQAPQSNWGRLRVSNFRAYVDLSAGTAGLQEVDVKVECTDARVRVLEKSPLQVAVRLEPVRQRSVPVRIRALDDAPVGFTMLAPKATPAQVVITGPAPLAESVSEAYVEVRVDGSKVSFVKSYQPQLRDAQGREVKDLEEVPSTVDVEVPIEQLRNFKSVSIKAVITGTQAPGYWISGIVVQPAAVTFGGDPQVLDAVSYVETAPVDITGAVTEVLKSVSIVTPPGIVLDKKQEVFVKVSVEPFPGGGILRRTLTWRNLSRGITATLSMATVDIRVDGPVPDLRSLKPTDFSPSVDLTGLLTGTYALPVTVTGVPTGTKIISVDPDKAGVYLR